jgi:hypothetical protein
MKKLVVVFALLLCGCGAVSWVADTATQVEVAAAVAAP